VPLPAACPELNAAENIWQYLRQTYLANRVFKSYILLMRIGGASLLRKVLSSQK
jgi:hypothetical protein